MDPFVVTTCAAERPPPGFSLSDYDYELPSELIAQRRRPRGTPSRLLVVDRASRHLEESTFDRLGRWLRPGDVVVRNDTKVLAARLTARRVRDEGSAPVELLLCHPLGDGAWEALARPAKRLRGGDRLEFADETQARVLGSGPDGSRLIRFADDQTAFSLMERLGSTPLPPYVHEPVADPAEYQTSYATRPGAVAAPTAGFHFTTEDFAAMSSAGLEVVDVTLHVGPGTFLPIRVEDLRQHRMHRERLEVRREARERIAAARREGRRIVALGTTSVRVLESLPRLDAGAAGAIAWTDLFIGPGHSFQNVDALITNFHLPRTSLLVLVSAFTGAGLLREAYARAVEHRFRFYSFGDGMVIL